MQIKIFQFNPIEENTYLIWDDSSKEAAIIDCGAYYPQEKEELKLFIEDNKLLPKHLLNTHLHLDHAFGNKFIYDCYQLLPQYHRSEEEMMPGLQQQATHFGMKVETLSLGAGRYLKEEDTISIGNTILKVLELPGHSPVSLCYYAKEEGVLFSGDVLFHGSIGRTDLWGGNYKLLVSGIKNKLLTLPGETVVYSGHGKSTTIGAEKIHNPFLKE